MDSDRPDIADILKEIEDATAWVAASSFAPLRNQTSWRSSGRFWLVSLSIHAALLALAFAFGGSRPFGRGGSPEGLFFSASFSTGEAGASGRADGNREIDTTIDGGAESADSLNAPFHAASSASATRPLLTLNPSDPAAVFNAEPTESLTAELASMRNAHDVRPATQQRLANDQQTTARSKPTVAQDREEIYSKGISNSEISSNETNGTSNAGQQHGQGTKSKRPGRSDSSAGDGDGGSATGTADGHRTTFFGIGAQAKRFVYLIDASESMHQHRAMQVARDELWESLQELTESVTFQVIFFNQKQQALSRRGERPKLLAATASNLRLAKQFLSSIQPDSGTDRLAALTHALSFDPDVIFVLTDADAPELTPKDLADFRRLNRRKAIINVVEFGKLPDISQDNFLKALARQHGGSHRYHNLTSPVDQ